MNKKICHIICLFTITLLSCNLQSQDSHLSQFYNTEMLFNPSMTGMFNEDFQAHLQYRNQWSSVVSNPFTTSLASFDMPIDKFGIGGYILYNNSGLSNLNITNAVISGAYEITNDPSGEHQLTTGIQVGFIQKNISPESLTFNNQFTGIGGAPYNTNLPNNESFVVDNFLLPDLNFGINYSNKSEKNKIHYRIGLAGFHLTRPKETFLGSENRIPIKYILRAGGSLDVANNDKLESHFLYMKQGNVNQFNFGVLYTKYLQSTEIYLFTGPYYRNFDAIIYHFGFIYNGCRVGISYDFNISSLSTVSNYRGAFEISITYRRALNMLLPSIY